MYPWDLDEDDEIELNTISADDDMETPPEYEIDFDTMTLTGRMISGVDAVKQWIKICLGIPRYLHTQYSWTYGQDFEDLIGRQYTEAELKPIMQRMISEALSKNSDITGITDLAVKKEGTKATVTFTVNTVYGDADVDQIIEL